MFAQVASIVVNFILSIFISAVKKPQEKQNNLETHEHVDHSGGFQVQMTSCCLLSAEDTNHPLNGTLK